MTYGKIEAVIAAAGIHFREILVEQELILIADIEIGWASVVGKGHGRNDTGEKVFFDREDVVLLTEEDVVVEDTIDPEGWAEVDVAEEEGLGGVGE